MPTDSLDRESAAYSLYLAGQPPTPYVREKYRDCHARVKSLSTGDSFDRLLVRIAARGSLWARFADSYAARFRKHGLLRKKLVLMLALLECAPPCFEYLDAASFKTAWLAFPRLAFTVAASALLMALSILLLLPVDLAMRTGKTS
jgi:hypothetical protein